MFYASYTYNFFCVNLSKLIIWCNLFNFHRLEWNLQLTGAYQINLNFWRMFLFCLVVEYMWEVNLFIQLNILLGQSPPRFWVWFSHKPKTFNICVVTAPWTTLKEKVTGLSDMTSKTKISYHGRFWHHKDPSLHKCDAYAKIYGTNMQSPLTNSSYAWCKL